MIKFSVKSYEELVQLMEDNQGTFFDLILIYIEKSILDNTDNPKICCITILDEENDIEFNCPKKNWLKSLNSALKYYEEIQEFEKCKKISDIINKQKHEVNM